MRKTEEHIEVQSENQYIQEVVKSIKNKNYINLVRQELEGHITDRIDYYKELGYDDETAIEKATEDMGDPEETAIPLNTLHSQKWYKQSFNITVITLLAVQLVLMFIFSKELKYNYSNHFIYKDFISTGLFIFNSIALYLGYIKRSYPILISHAIICISQIFINPYRPMFYGLIKILRYGFKGYINSIFSYEMVSGSLTATISALALFVTIVFALLTLIFAIALYRSERGKVYKKERQIYSKVYDISKSIISVFAVLTLVSISVCTAISYTKRYEIIEYNREMRRDIVEFILKTELDGKDEEQLIEEVEEFLEKAGYDYRCEFSEDGLREYYTGGECILITDGSMFSDTENNSLMIRYVDTITDKALPEIRNAYRCSEDEFNFSEGMTIEDFCKTNLTDKVNSIDKSNDDVVHQIYIRMDDGNYMIMNFENDVCIAIDSYENMMSYFNTDDAIVYEENYDAEYYADEEIEYEN